MTKRLKYYIKELLNNCIAYLSCFFRIFPIKNNRIMFFNFFGNGYGCNGKYICEYIINNNLDYELIWVVKNSKYKFPNQIKPVLKYSLRYFYYLATSKILIDNQHKSTDFAKRNNQYFIKTWHATIGLKKIGLDNPNNGEAHKKLLSYNNKITDLMITNCDYITKKFRRVFNYDGKFLNCGFPRTDILLSPIPKIINNTKKLLGINNSKKILLYAPTFREDLSLTYYDLNFEKIQKILNKISQKDWVILIKLHPHLSKQTIKTNTNDIINVSFYDDIQELMMISDILITDYSNVMFEFALTNKPVFIYAKDYLNYKKARDYYFTLEQLPFTIAKDNNELLENIVSFQENQYKSKVNDFYKKLNLQEKNNSSEILVNHIQQIINNDKQQSKHN